MILLTVSRKMTKILTVSRKSHHPIETLLKVIILDWNQGLSDTDFSC